MSLNEIPLAFALIGLALYTVLAGADFGAGLWQLTAGPGEHGRRIRDHALHAIGPVWEANHVWLIFVLTVTWTAYPVAFGSIASTLSVPLLIAAVGIILRGVAYALHSVAGQPREHRVIDTVFSLSSVLTPFSLGAAVGGIASRRVPVGNATGNMFSSWLNPTSILIGVLAVAVGAFLSAVFLSAEAARLARPESTVARLARPESEAEPEAEVEAEVEPEAEAERHLESEAERGPEAQVERDRVVELEQREVDLEEWFRVRALGSGVVAGAIALGGLLVLHSDARPLYHGLVESDGLPAVIVSALAGVTTLLLVWLRRFELARFTAGLAVAAIVLGWALAQRPVFLPGLTVAQAAAPHDTLVAVIVAVLAGALILFPSLALLFGLVLRGRFDPHHTAEAVTPTGRVILSASRPRLLARSAGACLIAGVGLLNIADASWAHAIGVVALLGFAILAFLAVAPADLARQ